MGQYNNNYPLVLLSGWNGWGEHDSIDAKGQFPYWNFFTSGDLIKHLEEKGFEVFHPSLGPWNSGWDRACILWAYLFGGRVDYGKVHSEKYHHARYGRTYPGVLKDLGQEGPHKKINIFGHSFGGPTVKEIANLFVNGSEEERAGTPADELSPLPFHGL
ncbi:MAG: lipase, partial [Clostridia bacterium]|nr:lipase [Clostridia bacterium]